MVKGLAAITGGLEERPGPYDTSVGSTQRQGGLTRSGTHHGPGYKLPLILISTLLNKYNYQPHLTDGELEEWRGYETPSNTQEVAEWDMNPGNMISELLLPSTREDWG